MYIYSWIHLLEALKTLLSKVTDKELTTTILKASHSTLRFKKQLALKLFIIKTYTNSVKTVCTIRASKELPTLYQKGTRIIVLG